MIIYEVIERWNIKHEKTHYTWWSAGRRFYFFKKEDAEAKVAEYTFNNLKAELQEIEVK